MWTVFGWLSIIEKKWLMQAKDLGNKLATSAYRWNLWWCLANLIDSYAKSFVLPKCQPGPWMWMRTSYGNGNRATKRGWEEDKEMKMEMQMSTKAPDGEADPHKYTQLTMIIKCYAKNRATATVDAAYWLLKEKLKLLWCHYIEEWQPDADIDIERAPKAMVTKGTAKQPNS